MSKEYWRICVEEALTENGLSATDGQVEAMAASMYSARQMESESCGYDRIPDPRVQEISDLKKALAREQGATFCGECKGRGLVTSSGPAHSSTSRCWKCSGLGKLYGGAQ